MKKTIFCVLLALMIPLVSLGQGNISQDRSEAIEKLNQVRAMMGLGYIHQDMRLRQAALNHARFGVENAGKPEIDAHHQAFLRNYFTGHGLADRVVRTGFRPVMPGAVSGNDFLCEVISPASLDHKDALKRLLDAPYHRDCLLDMHVVQIGFGCNTHQHDSSRYCVADLYGIGGQSFSRFSGLEPAEMLMGTSTCRTGHCPDQHTDSQKMFLPYLKASLAVSQGINRIDQRVMAGYEPRQEDLSLVNDKLFWLGRNGIYIEEPEQMQTLKCTENTDTVECQEFWDNPATALAIHEHQKALHYAHKVHEQVASEMRSNLRQWPELTYFPFDGSDHQVPTAFARDFEKPSPLPVGLEVSGYPISVYFSPLFNNVLLTDFSLVDKEGSSISLLQIDRDLDPNVLDDGNGKVSSPASHHSYIFLPVGVLEPGETYTMTISYRTKKAADNKWSGGSTHSWSFTTAYGQTIAEGDFPDAEKVSSCLTANHRAAACLVSTERKRSGCMDKIVSYRRACEAIYDRRSARWMTAEEAAEDLARGASQSGKKGRKRAGGGSLVDW